MEPLNETQKKQNIEMFKKPRQYKSEETKQKQLEGLKKHKQKEKDKERKTYMFGDIEKEEDKK